MLSFPAAIKVYLCTVPCDMRRSFDGLSMMAEHIIQCNPFSGHLLVFCNRRGDRLKILYSRPGRMGHLVQTAGGGHVSVSVCRDRTQGDCRLGTGPAAGGHRFEQGKAPEALQSAGRGDHGPRAGAHRGAGVKGDHFSC